MVYITVDKTLNQKVTWFCNALPSQKYEHAWYMQTCAAGWLISKFYLQVQFYRNKSTIKYGTLKQLTWKFPQIFQTISSSAIILEMKLWRYQHKVPLDTNAVEAIKTRSNSLSSHGTIIRPIWQPPSADFVRNWLIEVGGFLLIHNQIPLFQQIQSVLYCMVCIKLETIFLSFLF